MAPHPHPKGYDSKRPEGIGGLMIRQNMEGHRAVGNIEVDEGEFDAGGVYDQDYFRNASVDLGGA
jgi:hypothetical protein